MIMLTSKVSFACKVWNFLPFIFYSPSILIHGKSRCFSEKSAKICFAGIAAHLRQFTDRNLMFFRNQFLRVVHSEFRQE